MTLGVCAASGGDGTPLPVGSLGPSIGCVCCQPEGIWLCRQARPLAGRRLTYPDGARLFSELVSFPRQVHGQQGPSVELLFALPELKWSCNSNHDLRQVFHHQTPWFNLHILKSVSGIEQNFLFLREITSKREKGSHWAQALWPVDEGFPGRWAEWGRPERAPSVSRRE